MSDVNPPEDSTTPLGSEPAAPIEPTAPLPPTEPTAPLPAYGETQVPAAPAPATSGRGSKRTAIIALVAVVVVAVLGGGAFAAWKVFFSGGPRPDEALPASTIAYASLDLDPSAGQKIEAIKTIRKFPGLKDRVGLNTRDDLRKFIFDKVLDAASCSGVDYDTDIKPWIGKRAAVAAVDLGDKNPAPAIALQVTDQKKAQAGFEKLTKCDGIGGDLAFAVGEDYLIASDTTDHAKKILDEGQKHPLSEDAAYKKWTGEAGDKGVLNFYVAKKASSYLVDGLDQLKNSLGDELSSSSSSDGSFSYDPSSDGLGSSDSFSGESVPAKRSARTADDSCGDGLADAKKGLENFQGLAGSLRFADGGMELSVVTQGVDQLPSGGTVGPDVAKLPADTAAVVGLGIPDGYAANLFKGFTCGAGSSADDLINEAEQRTGLSFPDDLTTLLGSALTLSVGGNAPADLSSIDGFGDVPVGLLVHGDANKIKDLISTIEETAGFQLSDVPIDLKGDDSKLALSPSSGYLDDLLSDGKLGDDAGFKQAVPNADKAAGILYVNFNSSWRDTLIKFAKDQGASEDGVSQADENTKPLKSLGLSSWSDGGVAHVLLKLTTD